jgi:hypothetical protein
MLETAVACCPASIAFARPGAVPSIAVTHGTRSSANSPAPTLSVRIRAYACMTPVIMPYAPVSRDSSQRAARPGSAPTSYVLRQTTTSGLAATASEAVPVGAAPWVTSGAASAAVRFQTVVRCPARTKAAASADPIMPRPRTVTGVEAGCAGMPGLLLEGSGSCWVDALILVSGGEPDKYRLSGQIRTS